MTDMSQRPVRDWVRTMHLLQPYNTSRALLLSVISAVILSAVMLVGAVLPGTWQLRSGFHLGYIALANLLLFIALYSYNFFIIRCGAKGPRLVLLSLAGSFLIGSLFAPVEWSVENLLYHETSNIFSLTLIIADTAALIAYLISLLLWNVTNYQQTLVENEHLQTENMRIRFATLEQQVSPHFLFNSLNALDSLIGIDDPAAHRYLHSLSDMFRYSLRHQDRVSLSDELAFTRNYLSMLQMRYSPDALQVSLDIHPALLDRQLPPISLQLLIENAVKHNVVSSRYPLHITITSSLSPTPSISVSNSIQPQNQPGESTGTGLANLNGRYNLLFQRDIDINQTSSHFTVTLPLI